MENEEPKPLLDRVIKGVKGRQQTLSPRQIVLAAGIVAGLEWLFECLKAEASEAIEDRVTDS